MEKKTRIFPCSQRGGGGADSVRSGQGSVGRTELMGTQICLCPLPPLHLLEVTPTEKREAKPQGMFHLLRLP